MGRESSSGGGEFESAVDVGEVVAEELIELGAVGGFVFGAIPPAPVAAFGDEDLFVGEGALFGGDFVFVLVEGGAGVAEVLPGAVVFLGADPDIEVGVDPGAGEDAVEGAGGVAGDAFADGDGLHAGVGGDAGVELAEEFAAAFGEVLPGVFAVEDDGDEGVAAVAVFADAGEEVVGGFFGAHFGVDEADQVA
jgi:hypothetical protein